MKNDIAVYFILMLAAAVIFTACGGGGGGSVGGDPWGGTVMINTPVEDSASSVAVDADGNVYVAGWSDDDLHGHTNLGSFDGFVAMYSPAGVRVRTLMQNTPQWDVTEDVAVDADGNVYVAGSTSGPLNGHGSLGADSDGFVAMYNSAGDHEWTAMINTAGDDNALGVAVGADGNVYVAGDTQGDLHGHTNLGFSDGFVAMYNSAGGHEWTAMLNTSGWDYAYSVAVDAGGNVYVAGGTAGDLHGHTNMGATDGFVAMYNSTGGHEWTAMQNTAASDSTESVAVDAGGNIYVAGGTTGDLHGHTNLGAFDGYVVVYNSTGGQEWTAMQNTTAGDWTNDVAVSSDGNVYVAGGTSGDLHGHTNLGSSDGFVAVYNSAGGREWTAMINTPADERAVGVAMDTGGNAYVAGETDGGLHGHGSLGADYDGFAAKFSSSGVLK